MKNMNDNYEKIMDFLHGFRAKGMDLGLERVSAVAEKLANPQNSFPSIIVGGTNGKGSTSAMLSSILKEAGLRAGLYTSPHLFDIRERIAVGGEIAGKDDFAKAVDAVRNGGAENITFFELITLAAFLVFKKKRVDVAVLEVGLGGRLDAVNVAPASLSVITNVGLDHTDMLGGTLSSIAFEKSGIIKKNGTVLTAEREPESLKIIEEKALSEEAEMLIYGRDFSAENVFVSKKGTVFDFRSGNSEFKNLFIPLEGEFQALNASLAVEAALIFFKQRDLAIHCEAIRKGLQNVVWRGRMERIFFSEREVLFDCAHNSHAARYLSEHLEKESRSKEIILVYGTLRDKDYTESLRAYKKVAKKIFLTKPENPRAEDPYAIKEKLFANNRDVIVEENPQEALKKACIESTSTGLVCVTGSIFLVAPLLKLADSDRENKPLSA